MKTWHIGADSAARCAPRPEQTPGQSGRKPQTLGPFIRGGRARSPVPPGCLRPLLGCSGPTNLAERPRPVRQGLYPTLLPYCLEFLPHPNEADSAVTSQTRTQRSARSRNRPAATGLLAAGPEWTARLLAGEPVTRVLPFPPASGWTLPRTPRPPPPPLRPAEVHALRGSPESGRGGGLGGRKVGEAASARRAGRPGSAVASSGSQSARWRGRGAGSRAGRRATARSGARQAPPGRE